jgi:hypothetical protein
MHASAVDPFKGMDLAAFQARQISVKLRDLSLPLTTIRRVVLGGIRWFPVAVLGTVEHMTALTV